MSTMFKIISFVIYDRYCVSYLCTILGDDVNILDRLPNLNVFMFIHIL